MNLSDFLFFWPSWKFLTRVPGKRAHMLGSKPKKHYYIRGYLNIVTSAFKVTSANMETFSITSALFYTFFHSRILQGTFLDFIANFKFGLFWQNFGHFWYKLLMTIVTSKEHRPFSIRNLNFDDFSHSRILQGTFLDFIANFKFGLFWQNFGHS